jgi:bile acid:Na+ symporter, BASS family
LAELQKITAIVLLLSMMLHAGVQADRGEIVAVLRNYGLLLRALLANFIVVPLVAYLVTSVLHVSDLVATGILLMAIAPGVPFVILAGGRGKGGSHEFAVTLAVLLPLVSFLTIPITAEFVLPVSDRVFVPLGQLYALLLLQIAPLLAGVLLVAVAPAVARSLIAPLGRITVIALLALLAILIPGITRSLVTIFGSLGIIAVVAVDMAALATGWLLGGPRRDERFTLAIGTALRNPAIAMVIATEKFPGPMVPAVVTTYFLVQFLGATLFGRVKNSTGTSP